MNNVTELLQMFYYEINTKSSKLEIIKLDWKKVNDDCHLNIYWWRGEGLLKSLYMIK